MDEELSARWEMKDGFKFLRTNGIDVDEVLSGDSPLCLYLFETCLQDFIDSYDSYINNLESDMNTKDYVHFGTLMVLKNVSRDLGLNNLNEIVDEAIGRFAVNDENIYRLKKEEYDNLNLVDGNYNKIINELDRVNSFAIKYFKRDYL